MTETLLSTIRAEIASLEAELKADPRFAKLEGLKSVLALYEQPPGHPEEVHTVVSVQAHGHKMGTPTRSSERSVAPRKTSEARAQAEHLSAEFLKGRTDPTPTRLIDEMLLERGVEIGGANRISNLSAILSKSGLFRPVGRKGWLLNERQDDDGAAAEPEYIADESAALGDRMHSTPVDEQDGI